ncbi:hypothetical protein D9619_008222 [Psilocybe cf. subviscida]|uniref:Protein kinase domain-containing protein n=1 Tax=Psilocybe cf. subviscida TaxID=2480587 RepID=A0A8H5ESB4_9AGAR|nr:hypothetical protein D9619_008222 [Psilocybe cf. subviscida]
MAELPNSLKYSTLVATVLCVARSTHVIPRNHTPSGAWLPLDTNPRVGNKVTSAKLHLASTHPGVATLHRVINDENFIYIVMDYAADHDLCTQILHSCRYLGQNDLIKDIFLQLIDAPSTAILGIYHRALKPGNIICFDGGLRVAVSDSALLRQKRSAMNSALAACATSVQNVKDYSPMFNGI